MKIIRALALTWAFGLLLGACSSTPPTVPAVDQKPAATPVTIPVPVAPPATAVAPAAPIPASAAPASRMPAHLDPKSPISANRSVYFALDDAAVKSEYGPMIELHGRYLAANPALRIRLEGNADERGGSEYNLALGQRRAETVRQALKLYGARDTQMEAVSWGKERPQAPGHDESAWTQNRRVDLVYR